jgi:superfamily II DNA or RNA helicase
VTPVDLERLAHLPREQELDGAEWAAEYTRRYSRAPHAPTQTLRPIQGLMLAQAERAGGLVALAACGEGKTLASLLLPAVLGAKRAIILLPAAMRAQYLGDRESYGAHWHLEPMEPMSYEGLSSPAQVARLEELAPDLIVCDEAHNLKNLKSARARRLEAYLARTGAKLCALSGTLVSRSLREYAPVMNWALGPWSPLPRENAHIETWAQVVEEGTLDRAARGWFERAHEGLEGSYEQRLHQRLRASRGVVITKSQLQV